MFRLNKPNKQVHKPNAPANRVTRLALAKALTGLNLTLWLALPDRV